MHTLPFPRRYGFFFVLGFTLLVLSAVQAAQKPVFLYSRYFNAEGEERYAPNGTYKDVLEKLRADFEVRVHNKPLNATTLGGVNVVLISNPSDKAFKDFPAPPHFSEQDIEALVRFVENGGGLIIMANQEDHNLETDATNKLMARFGMQFVNSYSDAKKLVLPKQAPLIGGLTWAYFTGNLVALQPNHPARPRPVVQNDLSQKPIKGPRDQEGALLAASRPGKGRVVAVTDSGWIINDALAGKVVGEVLIERHDNWEIFRRLALWAAQAQNPPAAQLPLPH